MKQKIKIVLYIIIVGALFAFSTTPKDNSGAALTKEPIVRQKSSIETQTASTRGISPDNTKTNWSKIRDMFL